MKKNLFVSMGCLLMCLGYALPSSAGYCSCAGRCATGASCNCSTGACTIPSRYASGYVDTATPVVYAPQAYPTYAAPTPYRTSAPARKYAPLRPVPYMAVRLGLHSLEGEVKYTSTVSRISHEGGTWQKDYDDDVFAGALALV